MNYQKKKWSALFTEAEINAFLPVGGVPEYHAIVRLTEANCDAAEQFCRIETTIKLLQEYLKETVLVWKRYFVSDAINQHVYINHSDEKAAISIVQQPPLNGAKVAVWLYFVPKIQLKKEGEGTIMSHSSYCHLYHTQIYAQGTDEATQTQALFNHYVRLLAAMGCTLEKHCQRTWIFLQNVDTHYSDMVDVRRKCFEQEGLTENTHYIASTGIAGKYIYQDVLVFMDAYAVQGLQPEQVTYLYASTHLNRTNQYGVTFERGTSIQYGDRRHIYISGTASINNCGKIEHPMDLIKQTDRMFENIQTLLAEAYADLNDAMYLIIYLRDIADYETIASYMKQHYPRIPQVIVWAPVCRPGWLVEAECMAIKEVENKQFDDF